MGEWNFCFGAACRSWWDPWFAVAAASGGEINFRMDDASLEMAVAPAVLLATIVILRAEVARFHDLGFSGWWILATFVPLAGVPSVFLERWRGCGGVVTREKVVVDGEWYASGSKKNPERVERRGSPTTLGMTRPVF